MEAYIHPEDYHNEEVDNKDCIHGLFEYAYRGALLLKRERMGINNHHAKNSCDGDNLKPVFFKNLRIKEEVEETQPRIEAGNHECSTNNFSGSDSTANRDTMATTNIDPNPQKCFENNESCEMINSVEAPCQNKRKQVEIEASCQKKRKEIESYTAISTFILECKLVKGNPVSAYCEKMIGFIESLEKLGFPIESQELAIGIILGNLSDEYKSFIQNFRCYHDTTLNELHEMLKSYEITIKKENPIEKRKGKKQEIKKCNGKENGQFEKLNKFNFGLPPKRGAKSGDVCNYCNECGHWKRNCRKYLEDRKRAQSANVI